MSPAFSIVAIVAFWLLARALTSTLVATLASLLLSVNFAQIWFARVPTTEIMAQAFTLSGMYSGRIERPQFSVVMADGTSREVGNLLRRGNTVRVLGSQVDQVRFVPPSLCAAWHGARAVHVRFPRSGRLDVVSCQSH